MEEVLFVIQYVINFQKENGLFIYLDKGYWIDNYYIGYVLDCFDEFVCNFENYIFDINIKIGFDFYKKYFFILEGVLKFYLEKMYFIDCIVVL